VATLLWIWDLVAVALFGGSAAELGHWHGGTRDAAERELRAVAIVARPVLLRGAAGRNPEIACRCRRLLVRSEAAYREGRAWLVLCRPEMPDPVEFALDPDLKAGVAWVSERAGVDRSVTRYLWDDRTWELWVFAPWYTDPVWALQRCREYFRRPCGVGQP
jgi:hypothetical protein